MKNLSHFPKTDIRFWPAAIFLCLGGYATRDLYPLGMTQHDGHYAAWE